MLGSLQATACDDYRDAEPGKVMHELRLGELAKLGLVPHTPYYGSADATPLYLITLHTAWSCTGDRVAAAFQPSIVLLELALLDMSSYKVARILRERAQSHDLRLIALTPAANTPVASSLGCQALSAIF